MLQAGLGEKEIIFKDIDIDAEEFRNVIYENYPALQNGGGFQFYRCIPNTRNLEKLSATTLSSPSMLKSRVNNAKTYIKPMTSLQKGATRTLSLVLVKCLGKELGNEPRKERTPFSSICKEWMRIEHIL